MNITNPLDLILGDKLIDKVSGEIRLNNFSDLITISIENLTSNSVLYKVIPLGMSYYIISQKKKYSEARWFTAILKVEQGKVVKYEMTFI